MEYLHENSTSSPNEKGTFKDAHRHKTNYLREINIMKSTIESSRKILDTFTTYIHMIYVPNHDIYSLKLYVIIQPVVYVNISYMVYMKIWNGISSRKTQIFTKRKRNF